MIDEHKYMFKISESEALIKIWDSAAIVSEGIVSENAGAYLARDELLCGPAVLV